MSEERKTYTLAALNQSFERFIQNSFAHKTFWVIAEITKVREKSGHRYLELADSKDGKRIAEMSANLWFSTYNRLNIALKGELETILKAGNKVLLNVRIEFDSIFGLKLNVLDVDPAITYGEIEKKKKETIERLKKEELFHLQKALYLPPVVKRIALIGSPNTSGYRDFMTELTGNNIFTNFKVKEFAASVQGERAVKEIVVAIHKARQYDIEAIVLVRGGGSKMDLSVFNEYEIAKAICETRIPVITGIGHENDEVVADLVAHVSEITPTAVAKRFYVNAGVFRNNITTAFDSILKKAQGLIGVSKDEFNHTSKYLVHFTRNLLNENNNRIRENIHALHIGVTEMLESERASLNLSLNKAANHALNTVSLKKSTELSSRLEKVKMLSENVLDKAHIRVDNLAEILELLNPEQLLKKGYTITTIDNVDLTKYEGELQGVMMKTLSDSLLITSEITAVKPNKS